MVNNHLEYKNVIHIYINFSFININMTIGEDYKRNNKKEKGNRYCDYNMLEDYNTGTVLLS